MIEAKAKAQTINESIEMAKVHIFSENVHEKHTSAITNAYAFFLGIFIVLFSFFVEKAIPSMHSDLAPQFCCVELSTKDSLLRRHSREI